MKDSYKVLGDYIELVDERNKDLSINNLLGVSISKRFIPSIANIIGTDLSSYKIVRTGQFAYGPVTSRNGEKVSIAFLYEDDCIISSSYSVFKVTDTKQLDPQYLMLWFSRPEFDRYARYKSHGSVRESFDWDELCQVELPVPHIDKQRDIVKAYNIISDRVELKRKINDNLVAQAQALYKSWFEDYEPFEADESGNLVGWRTTTLDKVLTTSTTSINPQKLKCKEVWHYSIPAFDSESLPVADDPRSILSNKYSVPADSILVSKLNPDTKRIWMTNECFSNAVCSTEFIVFNPIQPEHRTFYFLLFNTKGFIDFLVSNATGSTNSRMRVKPASSLDYEFLLPPSFVLDDFCRLVSPMIDQIQGNLLEMRMLRNTIPISVAKLMSSSR